MSNVIAEHYWNYCSTLGFFGGDTVGVSILGLERRSDAATCPSCPWCRHAPGYSWFGREVALLCVGHLIGTHGYVVVQVENKTGYFKLLEEDEWLHKIHKETERRGGDRRQTELCSL